MYNKNRRGPRTEPRGTPQFISFRPEDNHLYKPACD